MAAGATIDGAATMRGREREASWSPAAAFLAAARTSGGGWRAAALWEAVPPEPLRRSDQQPCSEKQHSHGAEALIPF